MLASPRSIASMPRQKPVSWQSATAREVRSGARGIAAEPVPRVFICPDRHGLGGNKRATVMTYLILKAAISGIAVMLASEAARIKPAAGGLIASLPLVSVLAAIWLWRETGDAQRIALLLESTFWFVLPSLPMFLLVPALLRQGFNFWLCLVLGCVLTMTLYAFTLWLLPRLGIDL